MASEISYEEWLNSRDANTIRDMVDDIFMGRKNHVAFGSGEHALHLWRDLLRGKDNPNLTRASFYCHGETSKRDLAYMGEILQALPAASQISFNEFPHAALTELNRFIPSMPNVKQLSFSSCMKGERKDEQLLSRLVAKMPELEKLYFFNSVLKLEDYEQLAGLSLGKLKDISFTAAELSEDSCHAIAKLIRNNPMLEELDCRNGGLNADKLRPIAEALKASGLIRRVRLMDNPFAQGAGEILADMIDHIPSLRDISINNSPLDRESAEKLADAVARNRTLSSFVAQGTLTDEAMAEKFSHAVFCSNRHLVNVDMAQDRSVEGIVAAIAEKCTSPNLLQVHPGGRGTKILQLAVSNIDTVTQLMTKWARGERFSGCELRQLQARRPAILYGKTGAPAKSPISEQQFDAFMAALPKPPVDMQEDGYIDSLFTAQEDGYAPLDNPLLLTSADEARRLLAAPFSPADLKRKTADGSGLLDALSVQLPPSEIIRALNQRNIRIGEAHLFEDKFLPNEFCEACLTDEAAISCLFGRTNLAGIKKAELSLMYTVLTDKITQHIPSLPLLMLSCNDVGTRGRGR